MASTYLTRTQGTPTSADICTFSFWVKRSKIGAGASANGMFSERADSSNNVRFRFLDDDTIQFFQTDSDATSFNFITNRVFRDTSAWYNFVVKYDSTQSTSSDRVFIYINGVEETSWDTETYPSQNLDIRLNVSGRTAYVGSFGLGDYFDGSMSHVHFTDGTAYDASAFGEYDANGVWTINTSPSVTYGMVSLF